MTLQPYEPPMTPGLLNPVTDSWTVVLEQVGDLATRIAGTDFVPTALRGSVAKVAAAILYSRELGIPPMTGLASVHVVGGRPGISAELMRALILQAGHELAIVDSTADKCRIEGRRAGNERWTVATFTMTEAARAGLTEDRRSKEGKVTPSMYKVYPAEMLLARATTRLARMIFADVIHGMRSLEELQDMEIVGDPVIDYSQTVTVSRASEGPVEEAPAAASGVGPAVSAKAGGGVARSGAAPSSPPVERKRPPLRPRGAQAAAAPEPEPEPEPEPPAPEPAPESRPAADVAQSDLFNRAVTVAVMHFGRLGVTDRDERIWTTQVLTGRPDVTSTKDLSLAEVRGLAQQLEKLRDHDALEKLLGKADGQP